jgi:RNA polymerase sigma-70 factor (ECF subfamily)
VLLARPAPPLVVDEAAGPTMTDAERLTAMFTAHVDFVWRSLRRLGVEDAAVDDAAQEVFVVAQRKLRVIEPGKEKAFLFGTAVRVAADARRARGRRRETPNETAAATSPDGRAPTDELVEQKRARELLDRVIAALPDDARPVFVLYELEGMTMAEIAACLAIPPGTVASRLRRAREAFDVVIAAHKRGSDV